jgi:hypothetical protein
VVYRSRFVMGFGFVTRSRYVYASGFVTGSGFVKGFGFVTLWLPIHNFITVTFPTAANRALHHDIFCDKPKSWYDGPASR